AEPPTGRAGAPPAPPPAAPGAPASPDLGAVKARLATVADSRLPVALAVRPGDDALYVAEKGGTVRRVAHGQGGGQPAVDPGLVLDLSGEVSRGGEQGLLGLTFSPDGSKLYVDYTDRAGDTQVVEYPFTGTTAD